MTGRAGLVTAGVDEGIQTAEKIIGKDKISHGSSFHGQGGRTDAMWSQRCMNVQHLSMFIFPENSIVYLTGKSKKNKRQEVKTADFKGKSENISRICSRKEAAEYRCGESGI